jgi:hypothetical protein
MANLMLFERPKVSVSGFNIFGVVAVVSRALVERGLEAKAVEFRDQLWKQPDADATMQLVSEYVEIES